MPAKTREKPPIRDASQTREALIRAGGALFSRHGFDGVSVEEISREARVNKAMISYHFGGKDGLYQAVLSASFAPVAERMKAIRESPGSADERLREFIASFTEMTATRPELPTMILREALSGGRHLDSRVLPRFLDIFGTLREIVAQGVREGTFRPVNPLMTHLSIVGALVFFIVTSPLRERLIREGVIPASLPSMEDYSRHVQEMVSRGLASEGAPQPGKDDHDLP